MLFAVKNRLTPTLILSLVFIAVSLAAKSALGLTWGLEPYNGIFRDVIIASGVIIGSDMGISLILVLIFHTAYVRYYMRFVNYFRPQGVYQILAAGFIAGTEELIFRGVILEGLVSVLNIETAYAVLITGVIFGLCHAIPKRNAALFNVWAVWEGIVLGAVYVLSGSLLVCVIVHAVHDILGYALFALQRKRGFSLRNINTGFLDSL